LAWTSCDAFNFCLLFPLHTPRLGAQDLQVTRRILPQEFKTPHALEDEGSRTRRRVHQGRRRWFRVWVHKGDPVRSTLESLHTISIAISKSSYSLTLPLFQICVLALGSTYNFPFRSNSTSLADAKAALVDAQLALKNTQHNIVIVGGGPVRVEYAGGEILSHLSFRPATRSFFS